MPCAEGNKKGEKNMETDYKYLLPHLRAIMDYMAQEKKATRMEIINHLREQKYKYSDSAVGKHIRLLCELGYLEKVGRGVYVVVE